MAIGPDRVQVIKQESASLGGNGADEVGYLNAPINPQQDVIETAGVYLQDAANRDEAVYVARNGDDMVFRDVSNPVESTLSDLLAGGGGGISAAQHEAIDSLVHRVAETSYVEVTRTSGQVSSVIVWETSAKLKKVRETTVSRTSGQASTVVEKHYDAAGTVVVGQTLTHTIARSGGRVASIDTVQS